MASATRKRQRGGTRHVALSIIAVGDTPPNEFRIFAAGENTTSKGTYLFDEAAARAVMAGYEKHGIDVMIDLEHLSVADPDSSINFDPDARGWCRLEVRNGELWAVDVKWTADGAARLTEKRQRYISPVFGFDKKTRRIIDVLNIAITALPATDQLEPLVAASYGAPTNIAEGETMTPEQLAKCAEILGLGADANVEDVLATLAAVVKKVNDAANGAPADAGAEAAAAASDAPKEDDVPAMAAAKRLSVTTRTLSKLSGKTEISEAIAEIETWRKSHLSLEEERQKDATERATLEASERRKLVGELVKLNAETPATAWAEVDGVPDGKTPCKRLNDEPIAELRARVAKLTKAKGATPPPVTRPPAKGGDGEHGLSEREIALCKERKIDVSKYAATRAAIRAQSNHTQREGV